MHMTQLRHLQCLYIPFSLSLCVCNPVQTAQWSHQVREVSGSGSTGVTDSGLQGDCGQCVAPSHHHTLTPSHPHTITPSQLPFERVRGILNYLMTIPIHTDDGTNHTPCPAHPQTPPLSLSLSIELQLASFEIEPPENSGEKKRYQELRSPPSPTHTLTNTHTLTHSLTHTHTH